MDVEGNEEWTLKGMPQYLAGGAPAPIWCEVRGAASGRGKNSVYPVADFLRRFGYAPFQFVGDRLVPFRLSQDPAPQVFDLLFAVPKRHGKSCVSPTNNAVESADVRSPAKNRFKITAWQLLPALVLLSVALLFRKSSRAISLQSSYLRVSRRARFGLAALVHLNSSSTLLKSFWFSYWQTYEQNPGRR
jgi:hypothetical protein